MSNKGTMKSKVIAGLFWKLMENGGTNGIQLIVSVVLARKLKVSEYGIIAMVMICITIANVFVQNGFNTALIQKKDVDDADFSSVFYLNSAVSVLLYGIIYGIAPFVSSYYKADLTLLIRVLAIVVIIGGVNATQNAVVARKLMFKQLCISSFLAVVLSGIVGIVMAYQNFGVWSLVYQQIAYQLILGILLWFTVKWRPKAIFSMDRIKVLFSFGGKLLFSSLIDTIYNNLYDIVIGKVYSKKVLALYSKGNQFPQLIVNNVNGAIQAVMFPALSLEQDDTARVKTMVKRSISTSSFLLFPILIGLAASAKSVVIIVLTEKWLPCVPYLQLMCLAYAFWPIHTANLQAINAMGRSDVFLKLEIVKNIVGIIVLVISLPYGIMILVASKPVVSFLCTFINAYPNRTIINYKLLEQWKDILPSVLLSGIMGVCVYMVGYLGWNVWITLFVQVFLGVVLYLGIAYVVKMESFFYLINTVKEMRKKKDVQ